MAITKTRTPLFFGKHGPPLYLCVDSLHPSRYGSIFQASWSPFRKYIDTWYWTFWAGLINEIQNKIKTYFTDPPRTHTLFFENFVSIYFILYTYIVASKRTHDQLSRWHSFCFIDFFKKISKSRFFTKYSIFIKNDYEQFLAFLKGFQKK